MRSFFSDSALFVLVLGIFAMFIVCSVHIDNNTEQIKILKQKVEQLSVVKR